MAHFRQFQLLKYHREVSWNFELLALTAILSGGRFSYYALDVRDCVSFAIKCNAVSFQNRTFKSARRWTTSKWLWEDCWEIDAPTFCNQMHCCILKCKTFKRARYWTTFKTSPCSWVINAPTSDGRLYRIQHCNLCMLLIKRGPKY